MTWSIAILVVVFLLWAAVIIGLAWERLVSIRAESQVAKEDKQTDTDERQKEQDS